MWRAAAVVLLVSGLAPARAADDPAAMDFGYPWYDIDFEGNAKDCIARPRPEWCDAWFAAIDDARPKQRDFALPEWHRLTFERSLRICAALLPPDWCPAWREAMRAVAENPAYQATAAAKRAEVEARKAEARGRREAWEGLLRRVRSRSMTPDDVARIRSLAKDGDADALELLGWMHAKGYGVDMDFPKAYEFYGRAVMAGRRALTANLDAIWPYLNDAEKRRMQALFEEMSGARKTP